MREKGRVWIGLRIGEGLVLGWNDVMPMRRGWLGWLS